MNNGKTVQIPEMYTRRKLNTLYREIPLKDNVFRLLRKYVNAAANLYGILPVRVLFDIIEKHAPGKITKAEFLHFVEIARHEREDYYILGADEIYGDGRKTSLMDREIIDASLLYTNFEQYLHMKELQKSKPFYIPDKTELLWYNDSAFCDASEETAVLQSFVAAHLHSDTLEDSAVWRELIRSGRKWTMMPNTVIKKLAQMGIVLDNNRIRDTFLALFSAAQRTWRMQSNRGFTAGELDDKVLPYSSSPETIIYDTDFRKALLRGTVSAEELRLEILNMKVPNESIRNQLLLELVKSVAAINPARKQQKIGRNALCPCGSGRKYKKCCGR
jgi:hypothetical protein